MEAGDRLIAGRYRMRSLLGRGGAGAVWLAHDERLDRDVAVKEVEVGAERSERESSALRQRVLREARTAARLDEVGAVRVYDVFEEDDRAFIVMEVLDAPSLAELVADEGPLGEDAAARLGLDVLSTLAAAHREGIVHRDVKPSNVIVPASGPARLTDFGIAAVQGDPALTMTGMVLGSPAYLAPEQARDASVGPATDLWGLGALLYYAVEGRPPFERGQPVATVHAVVHDEPDPATRLDSLGPIVRSLLDKEPARRPDVDAVRGTLEAMTTEGSAVADAPAGAAASVPEVSPGRESAAVATAGTADGDGIRRGGRRRRGPVGWVIGLVLVGLLAWFAAGGGGEERPAEQASLAAAPAPPTATAAPTPEPEPASEPGAAPARTPPAQTDPQPTEPAPTEPASRDSNPGELPDDWQSYTDDAIGYTVAFPPDWQVLDREGSLTDFRDPETGTYLRVDWTDDPADDPVAAWESLSDALDQSKRDYEEISIEPTTYRGLDAALFEFTYSEDGTDLHAYDLGFTDGERGYALNLQTSEENWDESQDLWERLKQGFEPAPADG